MEKIEAPLIEAFGLLNSFFEQAKIRYCLIGGIAAGFWGEPRYTQDMDFTVSLRGGLDVLKQKLKSAHFLIRSKGNSQLQIHGNKKLRFQADVILSETEYQDWVLQRAKIVPVFDFKVPICSAEDLIILKLIANRRQDLLDIEKILEQQGSQLDFTYLKKWIAFWQLEERWDNEFKSFKPLTF